MYAIIDVGSNSIRLCIYQIQENRIQPLIDKKETAGLIGYVEEGKLTDKGIRKAAAVIGDFYHIAANFGIEKIAVFATASLRNIENREETCRYIEKVSGVYPEVISGEEEAHFDFVGATHFLQASDGLVVDIGGGSTELVRFMGHRAEGLCSLPIGSYQLYTQYVQGIFPKKDERKAIKAAVREELGGLDWPDTFTVGLVCGVGGTIRAFRKLSIELLNADETAECLPADYLHTLLKRLKDEGMEAYRRFYKVVPDRMLNIEPGLLLLREIVKKFEVQEIAVSKYGVREGYLLERMLKR